MIVDSSALVAIALGENYRASLLRAFETSDPRFMSAATYFESAIVIDGRGDRTLSGNLDGLIKKLKIQIEPVTQSQAVIARQAYRDFGKGSGHPAQLNFGDCFSYALAKEVDEPMLFVGDDFSHTDIRPVHVD